ncbi:MAG: Gfo/Idh/MocA family oxidoreductase [Pirellulales bacterium]|nr:Gfo/Idh/MocA family oxidoreductase [Pirellulales bacterium]
MNRLRLAVVGTGHLGRIHARLAAGLEEVQLVAVVDSEAAAREHVASETGAQPLSDCRDLFGRVDAAVIATPTQSHFHVAQELMQGGLHLLVEKPLAASLSEAEEMVALARRQQLVLQVGHVERFNPGLTSLGGKLSDPKFIEARRCSPYTFRSTDIGVVYDLMIHDIDVVLSLVRSPLEQVDALGISVLGDQEDMVSARLVFASGCVANLTASRVSYTPERSMQIMTPNCAASIDFAARRATLVEPSSEILAREFQVEALSQAKKDHLRENLFTDLLSKRELPVLEVNAIEQEQLDFARAIRTGEKPQVTGSAGRDAVAVAERILQQVAAHAWDGQQGARRGPLAIPQTTDVVSLPDSWSEDDTVIIRRKAG